MSIAWKRPLETPKAIFDGQLTPYRLQLWLRTYLLLLGSVYRISDHSNFLKHVFLHGSECDAMLERLSYVLRVSSPRCHCTATLSLISSSTLFVPLTILVYIYIYNNIMVNIIALQPGLPSADVHMGNSGSGKHI